jgi:hypothetical protein
MMRINLLVILVILLNFSAVCSYLTSTRQTPLRKFPLKSNSRRNFELKVFDTTVIEQGLEGVSRLLQGALGQTQLVNPTESTSVILSGVDINEAVGLNPLGNDLLIFLCATIGIVPLFKWLKASPVIGWQNIHIYKYMV